MVALRNYDIIADEKKVLLYVVCFVVGVYYLLRRRSKHDATNTIPIAPGSIPILGHAISYRSDPCKFLRNSYETCGPIFRINLASNRIIAIAGGGGDSSGKNDDHDVIKQVTHMPESIMSARQAVAEIGFEYSLGHANVYTGTDFHKRVLKDYVSGTGNGGGDKVKSNNTGAFVERQVSALRNALDVQLRRLGGLRNETNDEIVGQQRRLYVPDLFQFTRRVVLHATIAALVGTCLLDDDSDESILDEMMDLEDNIEDCTAKAAVLPKWLALPFVLRPVQSRREKLQRKIALAIEKEKMQRITNQHLNIPVDVQRWGPWLQAMEERSVSIPQMSELVVGLLFAAHKNPAIATAQSFCMLQEYASVEASKSTMGEKENWYRACTDEAELTLKKDLSTVDELEMHAPHLWNSIRETLRLCAHSIGAIRTTRQPVTLSVPVFPTSAGYTAADTTTTNNNNSNNAEKSEATTATYTIPAGQTIAILHNATNTDVRSWGNDALEYKPNRFVPHDGDAASSSSSPRPYATFSHGVHKCPGERVAMITIQILVALLITKNAKIERTSDAGVDDSGDGDNDGFINLPPLSFERATLAQRKGPVAITIDV